MRAVLQTYANNDPSLFKAVKVRFTKPAIPGQTLKIEMWQNQSRIHFKTSIVETGVEVITGGFVDLKEVKKSLPAPSSTATGGVSLQSDGIFRKIQDRIRESVETAKKINGVFLFNLTQNGKIVKTWSRKNLKECLWRAKINAKKTLISLSAVDLKSAQLYAGEPKGAPADTTLTLSDDDFIKLALGKLNPQVAFMKGILKIAGNIMLTQKLVPLLKTEAKL